MSANEQGERENIWYKPLTANDYGKIQEIGEVSFKIRILPSVEGNSLVDPVREKDVSNTMYPNAQKWFVPVVVCSDPLRPENNGFVGVMELSKTLHKRVTDSNRPPLYFAFNEGHLFNIVVSISKFKKDGSLFPNYAKSHFDQQPTPVNHTQIVQRMNDLGFLDFTAFVDSVNENLSKPKTQPQQQTMVNSQALTPAVDYTAGMTQTQPQVQPPVQQPAQQPTQQPNLGVTYQPQQPQQTQQSLSPQYQPQQPTPPPVNSNINWEQAPQVNIQGSQDFDNIFGTSDKIPF